MGKSTISTGPFSIANCKRLPEGKSPESHQPILTTKPPAEQCTWHSNPLPHRSKRPAPLLPAAWHRRWPVSPRCQWNIMRISWNFMKFHGKKLEKNHVNLAEKMFLFWAHKKKGWFRESWPFSKNTTHFRWNWGWCLRLCHTISTCCDNDLGDLTESLA